MISALNTFTLLLLNNRLFVKILAISSDQNDIFVSNCVDLWIRLSKLTWSSAHKVVDVLSLEKVGKCFVKLIKSSKEMYSNLRLLVNLNILTYFSSELFKISFLILLNLSLLYHVLFLIWCLRIIIFVYHYVVFFLFYSYLPIYVIFVMSHFNINVCCVLWINILFFIIFYL
jgi:hypothetical protein